MGGGGGGWGWRVQGLVSNTLCGNLNFFMGGVQPRLAVGICIEQQCDVGLSVSLSAILTLCTIRAAIEIAVLI